MSHYLCKQINEHTKIHYHQEVDQELVNVTSMLLNQSSPGDKCEGKFEFIRRHSSSEVYRFQYNNTVYYAKRFIAATIERYISQLAKGPQGIRCYNMANTLTSLNIQVPESIFVLSYRKNLLRSENIYLTKAFDGPSVFEFVLENLGQSHVKIAKVLSNLTSALGTLHRNQYIHDDTSTSNFLVNSKSLEICFIDLNSIYHQKKLSRDQILESLAPLNHGIFSVLVNNGMGHLYTPKRVQFYLKNILPQDQYPVDLQEAFSLLIKKTIKYLSGRGKNALLIEEYRRRFSEMI
jgi:serine/threonine protein kinase